jgi:hypothetical protein
MGRRVRRVSTLLLVVAFAGGAGTTGVQAARGPAPSAVGHAGAPTAVPAAPFVMSVAPRGLGALLTWTPNAATDQVTEYTATATAVSAAPPVGCSSPPSVTAPGTDSAVVVGGLCAQVAYTITLTASNAVGTGLASAASNPVVALPAQVPAAPLITSVLGRTASLLVSWSAPDDDGGSPITGYVLSATAGTQTVTVDRSASAIQATVTGLTNATLYSLQLLASNAVGNSPPAAGSGTPTAAYPPGPPQNFSAVPTGKGGVVAKWSAPVDNGGDAITGYRVTYQQVVPNSTGTGWVPAPGSKATTVKAGSTATSLTVSSLTPAAAYYSFSIAAVTAAGIGQKATIAAPVSPTTELTPKAVVLTQSTMNALASDVAGTLTWPAPAPSQVASLSVGQVLVVGSAPAAPDGLLATVQSIFQPSSGTYVIGTTPAALSDAFVDASFAQSGDPLATGGTFQATAPGVRAIGQPGVTFTTTRTLSIDLQQGPLLVRGTVDITPTVSVDITLNRGFAGIPDGATLSASGKVKETFAGTVGLSFKSTVKSWTFEIGEVDGAPIPIPDPPVVVVPKVTVDLVVSGDISVGFSLSVTVGAAISWSSSTDKLSAKNLSTPLHATAAPVPGLALSGSESIGVKITPEAEIDDATGPEIFAEGLLTGMVNFNPPPGEPFLSITPEVKMGVGWNIDLLFFAGRLELTLATKTFSPIVIEAAPPAFLSVTPADSYVLPGHQLTFTATRSSGGPYPLTWSLVGGIQADSISSSGVFTAAAPAGRSLTVTAKDSTGLIGKTTVSVGAPFDPPGNLTATVAPSGNSATLSWKAPKKTGGSPLSAYTVVTQPPITTQTLPASASGASVVGLMPGATYVVSVYAKDTGGLQSPPATASIVALTSGIAWSSPVNIDGSNALASVSCTSSSFCVAVDGNGNALTWDGTSWSAPVNIDPSTVLDSVSCSSTGFCVAVDSSGNALTWDGASWSAPVNIDGSPYLTSVSCTSSSFCAAVDIRGNALTWDGTSWSAPLNIDGSNALYSVSCTSSSFCVAVDSSGNALTWDGASWSAPINIDGSSPLVSVSCTSSSFCVAVDASDALTWNGTSWSAPVLIATDNDLLESVSCHSSSFCVAVDYSGNDLTWDGASWSAPVNIDAYGFFSVSCTSSSFCVAVDSSGNAVIGRT